MKLAFLAGFVGFAMLGLALGSNPFGYAAVLVAVGSGVMALVLWVGGLRWRDPYDLHDLQRIDAQERRRAIEDELEEIDSAGNAVCLTCGTHFDPMLNLCPRCGRSPFH